MGSTRRARIQLRTCNGRTEQQWFDVGISDTSPNLKYVNKWSGMCLQARDNSRESGAIIDQGRCQPALPSQMWTKLYTAFGFYKLINIGSRLTLDVVGGSTSEFTLFTQQPDHGGCCQAWYPG